MDQESRRVRRAFDGEAEAREVECDDLEGVDGGRPAFSPAFIVISKPRFDKVTLPFVSGPSSVRTMGANFAFRSAKTRPCLPR